MERLNMTKDELREIFQGVAFIRKSDKKTICDDVKEDTGGVFDCDECFLCPLFNEIIIKSMQNDALGK